MTEPSEDSLASDQKPPNSKPQRSLYFRLREAAHRKFPSAIPDPNRLEILKRSRERDEQDNAKTEPPADEFIDLRCVWAVEFYTPSQIAQLLRKFEELGWNIDDPASAQINPAEWIRQFRESAHGGGWYNLGPIHRPNERRFYAHGRPAPLPPGVDHALASMYSLTSSITCIVVGFVLDDTYSLRFEQALRQRRQSKLVPISGGGDRLSDPFSQKEDDIKAIRDDVRTLASDWFRIHLPGLFASKIMDHEFPTCEFVTLRKTTPFLSREQGSRQTSEWLRLLDLDHDFEAWHSETVPGLKFAWPLLRGRSNRFHAVIAAREDDFPEDDLRSFGGGDRVSYVIYVDQVVNALLSRWGLVGVLSGFERHLNMTRDSAAFDSRRAKRALPIIEAFAHHVAKSVDISAAAADLKRFSGQSHQFEHNLETFIPCYKRAYRDPDITLGKALREQVSERSQWLRHIDQSVRDLLTQYGSILGTRENITLQKRIGWLTWVIVVLTIIIVGLTAITAWPNIDWLWPIT